MILIFSKNISIHYVPLKNEYMVCYAYIWIHGWVILILSFPGKNEVMEKTKVLYSVYSDILISGKTCGLLERYRKQTTQEYFATQV